MNYENHIQMLIDSAKKQISFLKMNHIFGFGFKPIIALDVYNVTVRSKLLYASEILPINNKLGNRWINSFEQSASQQTI